MKHVYFAVKRVAPEEPPPDFADICWEVAERMSDARRVHDDNPRKRRAARKMQLTLAENLIKEARKLA